jgi:hypothetical protein
MTAIHRAIARMAPGLLRAFPCAAPRIVRAPDEKSFGGWILSAAAGVRDLSPYAVG